MLSHRNLTVPSSDGPIHDSWPALTFEDIKKHCIISYFHFPPLLPGDHYFKEHYWVLVSIETESFTSHLIHKKKEEEKSI